MHTKMHYQIFLLMCQCMYIILFMSLSFMMFPVLVLLVRDNRAPNLQDSPQQIKPAMPMTSLWSGGGSACVMVMVRWWLFYVVDSGFSKMPLQDNFSIHHFLVTRLVRASVWGHSCRSSQCWQGTRLISQENGWMRCWLVTLLGVEH